MLVFVEGGKPENQGKNPRSKDENEQQARPTHDNDTGSRNQTQFTLAEGKRSHHCAIPAPQMINVIRIGQFSPEQFSAI